MAVPNVVPHFTVQQYLMLERSSRERHEYLDGVIYGMAGESLDHGHISVNLSGVLREQLKKSPCFVLSKDTKILSGPNPHDKLSSRGLFSYPDVVVICGEPQPLDEHRDVFTNPKVIIEVLSKTTESFDRVEKCERYQMFNPTLTDYLLVAQDRPLVEHFTLQADGGWLLHRYRGLDAVVSIASIHCRLPLVEVYDRVTFSEVPDQSSFENLR
jgi:Uma2 family endonuclease